MNDLAYVSSLAKKACEIAVSDEMNRRRKLWSDHNSLILTPPPIYIREWASAEIPELNELKCQDEYMRTLERHFKETIYKYSLGDDSIFERWYTLRAAFLYPRDKMLWGFPLTDNTHPKDSGGKRGVVKIEPSIIKDEDIEKFKNPDS